MTLDDQLPHPRWVEAIRFGLAMQGATKAQAAWVARYFGMLGFDYVPMHSAVFVYIGGPLVVEFDRGSHVIAFAFDPRGNISLATYSRHAPDVVKSTPALAPEVVVNTGRMILKQLFGAALLSADEATLAEYEFDEAGVKDAEEPSRVGRDR